MCTLIESRDREAGSIDDCTIRTVSKTIYSTSNVFPQALSL